jgi:SAM-dependent methyltransferase
MKTGKIVYNPVGFFSIHGDPDSPANREAEEMCRLGIHFFTAGALQESINHFIRAVNLNPAISGAYYAIAVCLVKANQWDEAETFLKHELNLPEPHPGASSLLADLRRKKRPAGRKGETGTLTIFTIPKAFEGHISTIQINAIKSWLKLEPRPHIILFGNEKGTGDIAGRFGLRHIAQVKANEYGTPLVSEIFEKAQEEAASELVAYVNTDIILFQDFVTSLTQIPRNTGPYLVVGRRYDIGIWDALDFSESQLQSSLMDLVHSEGLLHASTGIDYFVFTNGLYSYIPPFAVGRTAWDNWLIWGARRYGARIIDATTAITAIHQDHDYNHSAGGFRQIWFGKEAQINRDLAGGNILTINDAEWSLTEGGQVVPRSPADNLPEPEIRDYIALKLTQAKGAMERNLYRQTSDLLEYIDIHLNGQAAPESLSLLKALIAYMNGDDARGREYLHDELEHYPGNADIRPYKGLMDADGAVPNTESVLKPGFMQVLGRMIQADRRYEPGRSNTILFINTYYPDFIDSHYRRNPGLSDASYDVQKNSLENACFGDSDFYSRGIRQAGWAADDLIVNCLPLQQAWARENGFAFQNFLDIAVEQVKRVQPDVVYLQDMTLANAGFLGAIRPFVKLIAGQIGSKIPEQALLSELDIIFTSFPHFVAPLREKGLTTYYQPLAFPEHVLQRPVSTERKYPVTFVGSLVGSHTWLKGAELLQALCTGNLPISLWGYGIEDHTGDSPVRKAYRGEAWGGDMFDIFRQSKITVNRHGEIAENFANNMRLFEATGCGTLLITDYKDNLNDLFEIGKEVVAYRSPEECVALVRYYLAHPEEGEAIARAGQSRTLRDHTYGTRMAQTADILQRHLRYREEHNLFPVVDHARISYGQSPISPAAVTTRMTSAWQDEKIPARQRALVQEELAAMYKGSVAASFRSLADILKPHAAPGSSVLEIGCASGYGYEILSYLLNLPLQYTGVDYSETMIAMAKDYYPRVRFFAADGANLFFADRQFPIVISSCILLHTPNFREHIFETARVAGKYGVAYRTPVCRRSPTRHMKKFAYGVETVEIIFQEEAFIREFQIQGMKLLDQKIYNADPAQDSYQVTYLFQRTS